MQERPDRIRRIARRWTLGTYAALAAASAAGAVWSWNGTPSAVLAAVLLPPLLLPLRGLVRGDRRTYAWATLCAVPGFIYGITEAVANPAMRPLANLILGSSLAWFCALVAYLRASRPTPSQPSRTP